MPVFPYTEREHIRTSAGISEEEHSRAHHVPPAQGSVPPCQPHGSWRGNSEEEVAEAVKLSVVSSSKSRLQTSRAEHRGLCCISALVPSPLSPVAALGTVQEPWCVEYRTVTFPKRVSSRESSIQIASATRWDTDVDWSCRRAPDSLKERTALHFGTLSFALLLKFPRIKRKGICEETRLIIDSKCIFIAFFNYH